MMSDLYDIATSGMAAQRTQMDLIADNLAHAGVVRADGGVFRPRSAIVESASAFAPALREAMLQPSPLPSFSDGGEEPISGFSLALDRGPSSVTFDDAQGTPAPAGVMVAGIVDQKRPPQYRLDPGNPFAQASGPHKGYVALPDVDPIQQMIELVASGRAYDADVSMLQAAKQMDLEAADIDRA